MLRTARSFRVIQRFSSLSYKHQIGDEPLLSMTTGKLLEKMAKKYPERKSIISAQNDKSVTYAELLRASDKLAAGLRRLGLVKGDKVAIWAPNSIEWEVAFFACSRTGLVAVHLNPDYRSNEMLHSIRKVGVKCIVCPEVTQRHNFYEVLKTVDESLFEGRTSKRVPTLEKVIVIGDNTPRGTFNFEEIQENVTEKEIAAIAKYQNNIDVDSGSNILFSSGSTGAPKAILLSHNNLVNSSYFFTKRLNYGEKHHTLLSQVPFFHIFGTAGSILGCLHFGLTSVIPSLYYKPEENLRALESEKCTIAYGTPTMFMDLINQQKEQKRKIQVEMVGTGGAPTTPKLVKDMFEILGVKQVVHFCGMTETTGPIFQSFPNEDEEQAANFVGHVGDHIEVKIVDADGKTVPWGTPGELYARGYLTMLGYYGDEESTAKIIGPDRWLKTGDQLVLYENGYGKMIGRIKDMIIRGGENIHPKEIEDFLSRHTKVLECQVVGIPHERLGEEVCACVLLKPDTKITLEELQNFCENQMARYKIPTKLRVMDEFPKTTSGKIQKLKLVEQIVKEL